MAILLAFALVLGWAGTASAAVSEWTWVSGADTPNSAGSYGVKGVPNASNVPPALSFPATWVDQTGDFWVFGGAISGGMPSNALWRWDGENWTWMSGSSTVGQTGNYGDKGIPASTNVPGARVGAATWMDLSGNLWLFGGWVYPAGNTLNDLWKWDGENWTWISGSNLTNQHGVYGVQGVPHTDNVPGARSDPAFWTDPDGSFWLFGGYGYPETGASGPLQDLWKWDGSQWTWIDGPDYLGMTGTYGTKNVPSAANIPGARGMSTTWVDPAGDFWLFGGQGYAAMGSGEAGNLNDLWRWDGENWTWVSGSTTIYESGVYGVKNVPDADNVPGAREGAVGWVDAGGNLWLFSGVCCLPGTTSTLQHYYNDLWKWDGENWTWVSGSPPPDQSGVYGTKGVSAASNVPRGRFAAGSFTDHSNNLWLFGGVSYPPMNAVTLNDLWKYETPEPVILSVTSHGFGVQTVGTPSAPYTVTLTNVGSATLNVGTLTPSGDFSVSSNTCTGAAVAPDATCTFDVTFTPSAAGARWGSVSVQSDAPGSPRTVSLAGTGVVAGSGATITVETTSDTASASDGLCTLREAITAANTNEPSGFVSGECAAGSGANTDTIAFNIPGSGTRTIDISVDLPAITSPVVIDGATQPGASCASWPPTLLVELRGPGWPGWPAVQGSTSFPIEHGLTLSAANSTIRGLVFSRWNLGILLSDGSNTVTCNYVGTDATGSTAQPNQMGVMTEGSSTNNVIGGTSATDRNLVSGNTNNGIIAGGRSVTIQGNYIGTDASGTYSISNGGNNLTGVGPGGGIVVTGGTNGAITIGGPTAAAGNLISGNNGGVGMVTGARNVLIQNNIIGLDSSGAAALPNWVGVSVFRKSGDNLRDNVISGNSAFGVYVQYLTSSDPDAPQIQGNKIGTDITGMNPVPNGSSANADGGIVVSTSNGVQINDNLIAYHNNVNDFGLRVMTSTLGTSENNCVYGNAQGLQFDAASGSLTFADNWWGAVSGPTIASNPGGTGDSILETSADSVTYAPFLTTPPAACAPVVSISPASPHDFGDQLVGTPSAPFTITLTNDGSVTLNVGPLSSTGDFSVSSNTCTDATVTPGETCTFDVTFSPASPGDKDGSVSIPSDAPGSPHTVSLSGTGTSPEADLEVTKTVSNATPGEGAEVDYTVTVENLGPNSASEVVVNDLLSDKLMYRSSLASEGTLYDFTTGEWEIGSLNSGQTVTLTLYVYVKTETTGQTITNTASVTQDTTTTVDPVPDNNTASVSILVSPIDVGLIKTVDDTTPNEGQTVTYTFTVHNYAPAATAGSVSVLDTLPVGLTYSGSASCMYAILTRTVDCYPGSLGPGSEAVISFQATVDSGTTGQTLTNSAHVIAIGLDPNPANNTSSVSLLVTPPAVNLVVNGDMELDANNNQRPDGWKVAGLTTKDELDLALANVHGGLRAMKITSDGSVKKLYQTLTLSGNAGDPFTFSAWGKGSNSATGVDSVYVQFLNGTRVKQTVKLNFPTGTYAYTQRTASITTLARFTSIKVTIQYSRKTGKAWFDDIVLTGP